MKKDNDSKTKKKQKVRFLTGPEVDMLRAFGEGWETIIADCYNKIYKAIEEDTRYGPSFEFQNILQRNAVRDYFEMKKFRTYCTISGLSVRILF